MRQEGENYMTKLQKVANAIQTRTGLMQEAGTCVLYGAYSGYTLYMMPFTAAGAYQLHLSVRRTDGVNPDVNLLKAAVKAEPAITNVMASNTHVTVSFRPKGNPENIAELAVRGLNFIVNWCYQNGYQSVCEKCGQPLPAEVVKVGLGRQILCQTCFAITVQEGEARQAAYDAKPENVVGGVVGAFLGSLIGVALIVLLGQLGFISAVSGIVMAVCALKGYELLGGKLTTKGIIISIAIMLVMVYLGDRIDWAVSIARQSDYGFFDAFKLLPKFMEADMIDSGAYAGNLAKMYLFAALGAVPSILSAVKGKKAANTASRM